MGPPSFLLGPPYKNKESEYYFFYFTDKVATKKVYIIGDFIRE